MEIEIRPKEPEDVIKIEKQAEAQKALAYARSLVPKIEQLATLDDKEGIKLCKKEIQHVVDKLMETINGKSRDTESVESDS
jgi:hypothetical protein